MSDDPRGDHRAWLVQAHHELASSFDRGVMTLSGGGLALSLAFVKDIAENPTHTCLLKTAWVLLAASLFLVLASFLVSQAAFQWEIKQLDEGADQRARGGGWGKGVVALNTSSALALAGGAVFLVLFAMYNI